MHLKEKEQVSTGYEARASCAYRVTILQNIPFSLPYWKGWHGALFYTFLNFRQLGANISPRRVCIARTLVTFLSLRSLDAQRYKKEKKYKDKKKEERKVMHNESHSVSLSLYV